MTKDGTLVSSDEYEVEMTAVPSLTLKMVSLDQSGKYECTISYDITKKEVHQLNLLVTRKFLLEPFWISLYYFHEIIEVKFDIEDFQFERSYT